MTFTERAATHTCHHPFCDRKVPPKMLACSPPHWFQLPKGLRDNIWVTYVDGQEVTMTPSEEYLAVAFECDKWWRDKAAGII